MKIFTYLIVLCLFVGLIIGAGALYKNLGEEYENENLNAGNLPEGDGGKASEGEEDASPVSKNTAPDFKVLNALGEQVNLSDYFGRPIVINFWATWCYYCKAEMPDFERAAKEHPDVLFMMVNVGESIDAGVAYVQRAGLELELFFDTDSEAAGIYGVSGFPTTFFIDANGNIASYARGKISYNRLVSELNTIKG